MGLIHIARSFCVPEDVHDFYENLLGMEKVKDFFLNKYPDIFMIKRTT